MNGVAPNFEVSFNNFEATINSNTGLPSTIKDSAGIQTSYTYDHAARPKSVTTPDGQTTTYTYTDASISGNSFTPAMVLADSNTVAGLGTVRAAYEYDALGRLHREKRLIESEWVYRDTEYDDRGFRKSASVWTKAPLSGPYPAPTNVTAFGDYDIFGRARQVTAPDSSVSTVIFSGISSVTRFANIALAVGSEAAVPTYEKYDRFGRLIEVDESSAPDGSLISSKYEYDAAGRLTSAKTGVAPAPTQTRTFAYDSRGFLTQETHPELGGVMHYEYDPRGHVTRKYIGAGSDSFDLKLVYDFAERLTLIKQATDEVAIKKWDYNDCGSVQAPADCDGRLQSAIRYNSDPVLGTIAVTDAYLYAASGRISRRTTTVGTNATFQGLEVQLDQSWNTFGLPATQSYPQCLSPAGCQGQSQSRTLTYGYTNGLLTSMPAWVSAIRYEPNGTVRAVEHGNGLNEVWVPDPKGMARPCRISAYWSFSTLNQNAGDDCGWSEPTTPVWTTGRYQYDGAGNIKQIGSTTYTYDPVSRLHEVTPGGGNTESYTYDAFGNRTTPPSTTQPCTFLPNGAFVCTAPSFMALDADPATNRVKTWGYDAAGNTTSDGLGGTFSWDGIGTMRSSLSAGRDVHFLYNADDERVALAERIAGRNKTTFTLRGLGNELLRTLVDDETSGSQVWSWKEDEIWRGGSLLANVNSAGTKHLVLDHLGSPRAISTTSTAGISVQNFSPFGMGGVAGSGSLMFTAHERDSAALGTAVAGLPDYMHARFYGASTGRFVSPDPVLNIKKAMREPQGWNRYSYVINNPLRYTDPDGREHVLEPGFTKPTSEWGEALRFDEQTPAVIKGTFYAEGALLTMAAGVAVAELGVSVVSSYQAWRAVRAGQVVASTATTAYKTAEAGGRHAGALANMATRSIGQVANAIKGYDRVVSQHLDKLRDPAKYIADWASKTNAEQQIILNKWVSDIARNKELRDVMQGLYDRLTK
ncbi:MAG TPA: RHS repeat-associated core domain-containing protein [Thermoanaerobaculia bacterium]|nr:RHS repeat-associated core domain-containing protein [Thermoanaerobaculia bacterium]